MIRISYDSNFLKDLQKNTENTNFSSYKFLELLHKNISVFCIFL